jgi:3D (Asp-Asp-Asp) domain-containing protein
MMRVIFYSLLSSPLVALGLWSNSPAISGTVLASELTSLGAIDKAVIDSQSKESWNKQTSPPAASNLAAEMGFQYRVFVLPRSESYEQRIRQVAPGAFPITVQGRQVLQVGVFRDRDTADAFRQELREQGLIAHVISVEEAEVAPGQTASPRPSNPTPAPSPAPAPPSTSSFTGTSFDLPAPSQSSLERRYTLWATYYRLHQANIARSGYPMLDRQGNALGITLSHRDWCDAALQGSVQVMDGSRVLGTYNFAGRGTYQQVDCAGFFPTLRTVQDTGRVRFGQASGPFGDGTAGFILVPYRTIAVDRSVIPIGSVIYIPEARGQWVTLPSGEQVVHDGYFYAADVGNAIQGNHIDVFAGTAQRSPFPFVQSRSSSTFTAYLVTDPTIRTALDSIHRTR